MMIAGWLAKSIRSPYYHNSGYNVCSYIFIQSREYAARKGTREKIKKKKVKKVIEKVGFVLPQKLDLMQKKTVSPLSCINDDWKSMPCDDVWIQRYHRSYVYNFEEAIKCHCETVHPTMLNIPNALVRACIALDMRTGKKNKFLDKFSSVIDPPHAFDSGETPATVLAFCKNKNEQKIAQEAGADFVGGADLIKQIQGGAFSVKDYDHIVAHADILAELLLIRGLLKRKFPNVRMGTLSSDVGKLVTKYKRGIRYRVTTDLKFKDYGQAEVIFGLLDMDVKQLKENFSAIINDIEARKPGSNRSFIQRVLIRSSVTREAFKIDFKPFLPLPNADGIEEEAEDNIGIISTH